MEFHHIPVMPGECLELLAVRPGGIYVDGTVGGGGHAVKIAEKLAGGRLVAIDKDPQAVEAARERLSPYPAAEVVRGDFAELESILDSLGIMRVDGILLDLGVSSHQLDTPERGFSYSADGPLDMRMSDAGKSAGDLLNTLDERELAAIFRRYGEEKFAARIARSIVRERQRSPLENTARLSEIIRAGIPAAARREGGHPAKRVFQALRIVVNGELDSLKAGLDAALCRLDAGGRLAVITFHSLEDRMVKQRFAAFATGCTCPPDFPVCVCGKRAEGKLVNKKPLLPTVEELAENPRSKSAKLRCVERIL